MTGCGGIDGRDAGRLREASRSTPAIAGHPQPRRRRVLELGEQTRTEGIALEGVARIGWWLSATDSSPMSRTMVAHSRAVSQVLPTSATARSIPARRHEPCVPRLLD